ncbi:putative protein OS=Streptomyces microflavus OX=1919 GN=Smic_05260 PE=4 SV=1 [Streptomyces microflavus]
MLHGHVLVLEPFGLPFSGVQQAGKALSDENLAGCRTGAGDLRAAGQFLAHGRAQFRRIASGLLQQAWDQTVLLIDECEQQVFSVHFGMPHAAGRGLGLLEGFLGFLCEAVPSMAVYHSSYRGHAGRFRAG